MTILVRNDFDVELIRGVGGDDSVLEAMLVSSLKDDTVAGMDDAGKRGRINYLMSNRHGTPFEHNSRTFRVVAPIVVYREWHRHRIGVSYNEQSGRYSKFEPIFYIPPAHRPLMQVGRPGHYEMVMAEPELYALMTEDMSMSYAITWKAYEHMLTAGVAREVARMVLPVAIYSTMYFTANARSLMAFLQLRTDEPESTFPSKPQWEIEVCARCIEMIFAEGFPLTYDCWQANGRVAP